MFNKISLGFFRDICCISDTIFKTFLKMFIPACPLLETGEVLQNFQHCLWHILLVLDDILNYLYGIEMTVLGGLKQLLCQLLVL